MDEVVYKDTDNQREGIQVLGNQVQFGGDVRIWKLSDFWIGLLEVGYFFTATFQNFLEKSDDCPLWSIFNECLEKCKVHLSDVSSARVESFSRFQILFPSSSHFLFKRCIRDDSLHLCHSILQPSTLFHHSLACMMGKPKGGLAARPKLDEEEPNNKRSRRKQVSMRIDVSSPELEDQPSGEEDPDTPPAMTPMK
ncbi:hypothetical protein GOP47_0015968, partial [Adiantum capillus-veneris]